MVANTNLTPTAVTREALRILHQRLNFIGTINRQYDDSFAQAGAKIGNSLKIRLPNEYTVRTGATLDVQNTIEASETLTVSTQKGVDVNFSSVELTMDMDDFSERILQPAMAVLAANIESDALSMYKDVAKEVSDVGAAITLGDVLNCAKEMDQALTPSSGRTLLLNPTDNVDLVSALSGLFNPQSNLSENFREGMVANQFLGFEQVYMNTMMPTHTTGTDDGTGDYLVNDAAGESDVSSITVDTGAGTWKKGDILTIGSVNDVHPETKASYGKLKQFAVAADVAASATEITITPALTLTGAKQNVDAAALNNALMYKREYDDSTAIGASADYKISMGYHKDAFVFATADLEMPRGVDFASRQILDGISLRIVRNYDINNDTFPCRIDVLYGYKTVRQQLACRLGFN